MFKVECVGCQAPYQVDERRVPANGLQMRCPKCGVSFRVESKLAEPAAAPSVVPARGGSSTMLGGTISEVPRAASKLSTGSKRDALSRTMIGVSVPRAGAEPEGNNKESRSAPFRMPRPDGSARPRSEAPAPTATKAELKEFTKQTVRDLPAVADVSESDALASFDASANLGHDAVAPVYAEPAPKPELVRLSQPELARAPGAVAAAPVGVAPRAAAPVPAAAQSEELEDLPAALRPTAARPLSPEDLPIAVDTRQLKPVPGLELTDLPEPVAAGVPKPPRRRARKPEAPAAELDAERSGPGVVPRRPPPRRREPPRPAQASAAVVDLPARLQDNEVDLPVVGGVGRSTAGVGLPSVAHKPSRAPQRGPNPGLDELDLPQVAPALRGRAQNDLPSVLSDPGLPAVFVDDYLPAVIGSELPAASDPALPALAPQRPGFGEVDLPTVSDAELPAVLGGSAGFGEVDLPLVGAALPALGDSARRAGSNADLPLVGQALPALRQPDLPVVGQALPALRYAELPAVGQVLPAVRAHDLPSVGQVLPALRQPDLPSVGQVLPALRENELPEVGQSLPARKQLQFGVDGAPQEDLEAAFDSLSFPPREEPFAGGDNPFGSAEGELEGNAQPAVAYGLGYGDLEMDGGGGEPIPTADDMEFSAIPEDGATPAPRAAASAAVHQADAQPASTLEVAPASRVRSPARSRRGLMLAGAVSLLAIAGGALSLKPALGPFGAHYIADQINRGQHQELLALTESAVRGELAEDTLVAVRGAIARVDGAAARAPRFAPLKAYAGFLRYWAVLRFGPLPELEAAGKAVVDGLDADAPRQERALALASAAKAAVSAPAAAKAEILALGDSVEARTLLGEAALANADAAAARPIWQQLVGSKSGGAQALFGLARTDLAQGKWREAAEEARQALVASPAHVGAKILLLEAARSADGAAGQAGAEAQHWVEEVNAVLPQAAPAEAVLAHTVLGELHLGHGRVGPAQKSFEDALSIVRQAPRALIGLGEVLYRSARYSEAVARFQAAVDADASSLLARIGVAKSQIDLGHVPEAKALLAKLQEQYPKHWEVVYWVGRVHEAMSTPQAALDAYRSAIELGESRPETLRSYLALAHLQGALGELSLAKQTLSEAEAKLPASAPLSKALGEIALSQGRFSEALTRFEASLGLDSADTHARFLAAVALTRLGRFDEALTAFMRVSESDKNFPGLALERGRLYEESGRTEEALKEYEAALGDAPNDTELQLRVGCGRVVLGRSKEADALLEQLQKSLPRTAEVYHCLGRSALQQGKLSDAVRLLDRAVALDASQAQFQLYVGWVANEVGRSSSAEAALERALELDKGLADAYWQRGVLRRKQGATRDAVKDLKHALELKPTRYEAYADLALSYADLGQNALALAAWERALAAQPDNALWLFRYGKLLAAGPEPRQAAVPLAKAVQLAAKAVQPSTEDGGDSVPWLWQAHYLLARALGNGADAIQHWQAYMRLSPANDPYRSEAQDRLRALGQPWDGR